MENVEYGGWSNNVRLSNAEVELIVTQDVGPRIIRFGFIGGPNIFGEIPAEMGTTGGDEWMNRGGHRLWIAPEAKPRSYELDNSPVRIEEIDGGIRTLQEPGEVTAMQKSLEITLETDTNLVTVLHKLTNTGNEAFELSPWALTVLTLNGTAIIPLPGKIPHTERLTHNQEWSIWAYTDFSDGRWTFGPRYLQFRQDPQLGPGKLGIAHREGWVAYQVGEFVFVKRFEYREGASYPDSGMNFETFSNEEILEIESLGPIVSVSPGETVCHEERWSLHRGISSCENDDEIDRHIRPLV